MYYDDINVTKRKTITNGKKYDFFVYNLLPLEKEFSRIRDVGYAECIEEFRKGVSSVAAPIRINNVGSGFSLGATGPSQRFDAKFRASIGQSLTKLSFEVARKLQNLSSERDQMSG